MVMLALVIGLQGEELHREEMKDEEFESAGDCRK
jgi:hypothetical protein